MDQTELIEEALGSPAKIRILRTLKKPGSGFMSVRELGRVTSLNPVTLSRTLSSLKSFGLVDFIRAGRSQLWRLVPSYASCVVSPILDAIKAVPRLRDIVGRLLQQAGPFPPDVAKIILYGSVVSEEATAASDVDLCVLLERDLRNLEVEGFFDRIRQTIFDALGMRVSLLPLNKRGFAHLKEPLKSHIHGGIVLYEKGQKSGS